MEYRHRWHIIEDWDDVLPPKTAVESPANLTTDSPPVSRETVASLASAVEKLQRDLTVAIMAINSQASKLEKLGEHAPATLESTANSISRTDFFLGCALIANAAATRDWGDLTVNEQHEFMLDDAVCLDRMSKDVGEL